MIPTSVIREKYTAEEIEQVKEKLVKACRGEIEHRLLCLIETGTCQSVWVPEGYIRNSKPMPKSSSIFAKYFNNE